MVDYRRLKISMVGDVTVVSFVERKILDVTNIQDLGDELYALVEQDGHTNLLLNFSEVEFLSSGALNLLIILNKKIKAVGGQLKLCELDANIYEVFMITRLNHLFEIKKSEAKGVAAFSE